MRALLHLDVQEGISAHNERFQEDQVRQAAGLALENLASRLVSDL
jgi:hypothetical protein